MIIRTGIRTARSAAKAIGICPHRVLRPSKPFFLSSTSQMQLQPPFICQTPSSTFHTSTIRHAQSPTADALMENLDDLYGTARDEFEIAAEETEKKTTYAEGDREAAKEAFVTLKEAYQQAVKESDPDVAKEIQTRVGQRIRELQNALTALEEKAMED